MFPCNNRTTTNKLNDTNPRPLALIHSLLNRTTVCNSFVIFRMQAVTGTHFIWSKPTDPFRYYAKPVEPLNLASLYKRTARQGFAVLYHKAPASARGFIAHFQATKTGL
jgi:hypothetical protein